MHSLVISFLGRDCPGIVAAVSSLLEEEKCDIIVVSQTISSGEFAAIFTVAAPKACTAEILNVHLVKGLEKHKVDLSVIVRPANETAWSDTVLASPFVVTANGPNSTGLVAALSGVFAKYNANIENLKAILNDRGDNNAFFIFEVKVPDVVATSALRKELQEAGEKFSLKISVQHRDIFEAINRVAPV